MDFEKESKEEPMVDDLIEEVIEEQVSEETQEAPKTASEREAELKAQVVRLQADFENAQKRWTKERSDIALFGKAEVLTPLLELSDDFERALDAGEELSEKDPFRVGVEMIWGRLQEVLKQFDVQPMDAKGSPFDPGLHNAVMHAEDATVDEGTVLEVLRQGYTMGDRVLRHAFVKVAKQPEAEEKAPEENSDSK